jgi:hypothetical protein
MAQCRLTTGRSRGICAISGCNSLDATRVAQLVVILFKPAKLSRAERQIIGVQRKTIFPSSESTSPMRALTWSTWTEGTMITLADINDANTRIAPIYDALPQSEMTP